jgi:hypothetical protein
MSHWGLPPGREQAGGGGGIRERGLGVEELQWWSENPTEDSQRGASRPGNRSPQRMNNRAQMTMAAEGQSNGGGGGVVVRMLLLLKIRDGCLIAAGLSIWLLSHTPTVCRTKGHDRQSLGGAEQQRSQQGVQEAPPQAGRGKGTLQDHPTPSPVLHSKAPPCCRASVSSLGYERHDS